MALFRDSGPVRRQRSQPLRASPSRSFPRDDSASPTSDSFPPAVERVESGLRATSLSKMAAELRATKSAEAGASTRDQHCPPTGRPAADRRSWPRIESIWMLLKTLSALRVDLGDRKLRDNSVTGTGCDEYPSMLSSTHGVLGLDGLIVRMHGLLFGWRLVDEVKDECVQRLGVLSRRIPRTRCRPLKPQGSDAGRQPGCVLLTLSVLALIVPTSLAAQTETFVISNTDDNRLPGQQGKDFFLGPCLVNTNQTCPDDEITFFLFTVHNPFTGQQVFVDNTTSNLAETNFVPSRPTKIVVHGYNSDMQLSSLVDIRDEYLKRGQYNVIHVDWHRLAIAPCYPIAVHNVPHVGDCLAQLIDRLREYGSTDIHVIGFSLGAHVPAFAANVLRPYKLSRITGLDPAMPLFVAVDKDEKLDAGDAEFVDVFHTNAFIQGQVEASGTIDFYMNGGVNQPGCWEKRNPFGCNHHRSADYFAESINTEVGFWGWPCSGFVAYLLGLCPPRFPAVLAGDKVDRRYSGFHLVKTRAESPYAEGLFPVNLQDMHQ